MSEEEVVVAAPEPAVEPQPEPATEQGDGKQFVDFDALPAPVKARFNRIYGNMKEYERVNGELSQFNRVLVERLEKLETRDNETTVRSLEREQRLAYEEGDFDKAQKLANDILEHKLASKQQSKIEVPEFKPEPGPLQDDQMDVLAAWARETNDQGAPLRPWAVPGHKDHDRAVRLIQAAAMDPDYNVETPEGMKSLLAHVDQRMQGKSNGGVATVLSGVGDSRPTPGAKAPRLTPEQIRAAEGMGYTPKQYAELMQKYGKD